MGFLLKYRHSLLASILSIAAIVGVIYSYTNTAHASVETPSPTSSPSESNFDFMRFIQPISKEVMDLRSTISGFADSFTTGTLSFSKGTGSKLTVDTLCVGSTCVDAAQFQAIESAIAAGQSVGNIDSDNTLSSTSTDATSTNELSGDASTTPPSISINGNNPAIVTIGDTYNDLGATITGPQSDLNLGVETFLNGSPMSPIQINTSASATDTIEYVVTDSNDLTSTSTRTVIIEPNALLLPSPDAFLSNSSSTDDAASTSAWVIATSSSK